MVVTFHEVIIVGGGTAGLYTARSLLAAGVRDVIVLESRPFVGGRVTTTRNADGQPLFNNFAWRVSEANPMMLRLCRDLQLTLVKQTTPPAADPDQGHGVCKHGVLSSMACGCESDNEIRKEAAQIGKDNPRRAPLSDFAAASLDSTAAADLQDRESGYAGRTAQISFPDESHGTECWFVEGGMDRVPKALADALPDGCLHTNVRVGQVEKIKMDRNDGDAGNAGNGAQYRIAAVKRDGNTYTELALECAQVVLATPPYSLRGLAVAQDMQPALMALHERRLGHVYAVCPPGTENVSDTSTGPDRIYRKLPDSILQQHISGDYGHGVFQVCA